MNFFKKKPTYKCKHCGMKHKTAFMARICYDLDMKMLEHYGNDDKKGKNKNVHS